MNMITCAESCRWQKDGFCTLEKLTAASAAHSSDCRYFEPLQGADNNYSG
ncbi:MAG: hypothetical protein ACI4XA_07720 [Oscillospiraceae bacterium]